MKPDLNPCEFCGKNPDVQSFSERGYYVICLYCYYRGPIRCTESLARKAWNRKET